MEGSHDFRNHGSRDLAATFDPWGQNYVVCSCRTGDGRLLAWEGDFALYNVASAGSDGVARLAAKVAELTDSGAHAPVAADAPARNASEPWWRRIFHSKKSAQPHSDSSSNAAGHAPDATGTPDFLYDRQAHTEAEITGIHIDFPTRQIRWWTDAAGNWDESDWDFDGAWHGWSVETWGDDASPQEQIIGRPLMDWQYEYDCTLDTFTYSGSPSQLVTDCLTPFADHMPPPARIITRHGTVVPAL